MHMEAAEAIGQGGRPPSFCRSYFWPPRFELHSPIRTFNITADVKQFTV